MGLKEEAIKLHKKLRGKIEVKSKIPIKDLKFLSLLYTPGVAEAAREIARDKSKVYEYTSKWNSVGIITDGSRVLGLGNIGPEAALAVMEGKSILFKIFGNVDAFPICLATQNTDDIVEITKKLSPTFGGINIEDIDSPRCFDIVDRLEKEIDIPVFHDDQDGTGIVVTAALMNSLKIVGKELKDVNITIAGAGSAGAGITKVLNYYGVDDILLLDSKGLIYEGRHDLDSYKKKLATTTNKHKRQGGLIDAIEGADVFIGVSGIPNLIGKDVIKKMNDKPIVFALSNPDPEILPKHAIKGGAAIVATGRSDFPNQVNNSLVFPGIFRGALDSHARKINKEMHMAVIETLIKMVDENKLDKGDILPKMTDKNIVKKISSAVADAARKSGVAKS